MILLHLVICVVFSSSYAQNLSIDDTSPSWNYNPPVCQDFCDGTQSGIQQSWWQLANQRNSTLMQGFFNLTETATNLIGATATLNFKGTAIYYYGNVAPWGGVMAMTLDGNTMNVNTVNSGPEQHQTLVYSQTGLDGSQQHTLTVKMIGGTYIDVDRVDITPPSSTSSSSSSSSSTSTSTSSSTSKSSSPSNSSSSSSTSTTMGATQSAIATTGTSTGKSDVGVIVGSVVASAVVVGLCILFAAWWTRHRRLKLEAEVVTIYPKNTIERRTPSPRVQREECDSGNNLNATASGFLTPQPSDALLGECEDSPEPPPYVPYTSDMGLVLYHTPEQN